MTDELKFIQVGDLVKGITESILPASGDLSGSTVTLYFEDGQIQRLCFHTPDALSWQSGTISGQDHWVDATYRATCLRSGIYLVDFIDPSRNAASISLVVNLNTQSALWVTGTLPGEPEAHISLLGRIQQSLPLTSVAVVFRTAGINRPLGKGDNPHPITNELVGKRIQYVYSKTEIYEHIYLNANLYTWHCLKGAEKGLADTDRCHYYKIAQDLFLFVWREKVIPTLGVVIVDLQQMKTSGKLFGYEGADFGNLINSPIRAHAMVLNQT
jgi:hypothetical protein